MHFRKKKTQEKYNTYRVNKVKKSACDFCVSEPDDKKLNFVYWKILKNMFPYDRIAEHHELIIPKRHFKNEADMTPEEREELVYIKAHQLAKDKKYDFIWENFTHIRSVEHYHLHLLSFKR